MMANRDVLNQSYVEEVDEDVPGLNEEAESILLCSEGQQSFEESSNPMLNGVVVQTLFEYVSLTELKNLRKVCKFWWNVSLPRWRRQVWLKLEQRKQIMSNGTLALEQYLELADDKEPGGDFYQFGKHPYRQYRLQNWALRLAGVDAARQLKFWNSCGPQMTSLSIKESVFSTPSDFETILFQCVKNLKALHLERVDYNTNQADIGRAILRNNIASDAIVKVESLTELKLEGIRGIPRSGGEFRHNALKNMLPVTWFEFFGHYPNVKSLLIDSSVRLQTDAEMEEILNVMLILARDYGFEWKMHNLYPRCVMHWIHVPLHEQLQFPLTTLSLNRWVEVSARTVKGLLKIYAKTLRKLVLSHEEFSTPNDVVDVLDHRAFPFGIQLDSLSELWLGSESRCHSLNFLSFTPNLRKLFIICEYDGYADSGICAAKPYLSNPDTLSSFPGIYNGNGRLSILSNTDFFILGDTVCSQLQEFILSDGVEKVCSPSQVAALTNVMPNLKTVMIGMGNDGFRIACEAWKELEVLIIEPCEVDEYGITGRIPKSQTRFPNLTDLCCLRYFGIGNGMNANESSKVYLSEAAVVNGILPLENLRDVTIACSNEISEEVFRELTSKFPHSRIKKKEKVALVENVEDDDRFSWSSANSVHYSSSSGADDDEGDSDGEAHPSDDELDPFGDRDEIDNRSESNGSVSDRDDMEMEVGENARDEEEEQGND